MLQTPSSTRPCIQPSTSQEEEQAGASHDLTNVEDPVLEAEGEHIATGSSGGGDNDNNRTTTDTRTTIASAYPAFGRKRKAYVQDPLESTLQQYLENKQANRRSDDLDAWAANLTATMRSMNNRRRKCLRLSVDELVCQLLREELDS